MRRRLSRPAALISALLMLVAGAASITAQGASSSADCGPIQNVPAVGPACRASNGLWRITLPDGSFTYTHGGDGPSPAANDPRTAYSRPKAPACVADPSQEYHIELFYARAPNTKSRFKTMRGEIERMLGVVNSLINAEAGTFGRKMSLRALCAGGVPLVREVGLSTPLKSTSFGSVASEFYELGYRSTRAKYWIWFDGRPGRALGTANFDNDDRLIANNRSMTSTGWNVTWGVPLKYGGAAVMLHEGGHNLGAVSISAPNSTGAAHCVDGNDIMCYADGGPYESKFSRTVCDDRAWFDCRHNDYFNASPRKGSYLSTHWNLASPYQRYIGGCSYRTGVLKAGLTGQDPESTTRDVAPLDDELVARTHTLSSSCSGRPFAFSSVTAVPAQVQDIVDQVVDETSIVVSTKPPERSDVDACFYKGSALLKCYTGSADRGTVPKGANRVRIILITGAETLYVFNAI